MSTGHIFCFASVGRVYRKILKDIYLLGYPSCINIYQTNDASQLLSSNGLLLDQGEYQLLDFKTNPRLTKHNDKNLENRIFIEDIYTDKLYEVTLEDLQHIELSENYDQAIQKVLKNEDLHLDVYFTVRHLKYQNCLFATFCDFFAKKYTFPTC